MRTDVSDVNRSDASGVEEVRLSVLGVDANAASRSLHEWLAEREELRGVVSQVVAASPPGAMGPVLDLVLKLGPGAARAIASVLTSWVRRQAGKVSVTVKRANGAGFTLEVDQVRGLTSHELGAMVDQLTQALDASGPQVIDGGYPQALGGGAPEALGGVEEPDGDHPAG